VRRLRATCSGGTRERRPPRVPLGGVLPDQQPGLGQRPGPVAGMHTRPRGDLFQGHRRITTGSHPDSLCARPPGVPALSAPAPPGRPGPPSGREPGDVRPASLSTNADDCLLPRDRGYRHATRSAAPSRPCGPVPGRRPRSRWGHAYHQRGRLGPVRRHRGHRCSFVRVTVLGTGPLGTPPQPARPAGRSRSGRGAPGVSSRPGAAGLGAAGGGAGGRGGRGYRRAAARQPAPGHRYRRVPGGAGGAGGRDPGWPRPADMWMVSHFHYDPVWWDTQGDFTESGLLLPADGACRRCAPRSSRGGAPDEARGTRTTSSSCRDRLPEAVPGHPPRDRARPAPVPGGGASRDRGRQLQRAQHEPDRAESTIRNAVYGLAYQRTCRGRPRTAWMLDASATTRYPGLMAAAGLAESSWARAPYPWGPQRTVGTTPGCRCSSESSESPREACCAASIRVLSPTGPLRPTGDRGPGQDDWQPGRGHQPRVPRVVAERVRASRRPRVAPGPRPAGRRDRRPRCGIVDSAPVRSCWARCSCRPRSRPGPRPGTGAGRPGPRGGCPGTGFR